MLVYICTPEAACVQRKIMSGINVEDLCLMAVRMSVEPSCTYRDQIYYFIFHYTPHFTFAFPVSIALILNRLSGSVRRGRTNTNTHTQTQTYRNIYAYGYVHHNHQNSLHTNDIAMETRPGFAFRPGDCYLATGQRPLLFTSLCTLPPIPFKIKALSRTTEILHKHKSI